MSGISLQDFKHPMGLMWKIPPRLLSQLKARVIPSFDLNSKWARTVPSVGNLSWNIYRTPPPPKKKKYKYGSRYFTPCCGLEVQNHIQALTAVNGLGNTFDLNPTWGRTLPLEIVHGIFIEPPPPKYRS